MVALPDKPLPYGTLVSRELLETIVQHIADEIKPEKIVLFGSYARGNPGPDSDLDFLIIMRTDLPKCERTMPVRRLFNPQPCPMDVLVYTPEEIAYWNGTTNHIITEVLETGRVCYEQKRP